MWSNGFTLDAYKRALSNTGGILNGLLVSAQVTVFGTITAMVLTCLAGYVLSKKDLPGRKIMFGFVLFTMFFNGGLMPFYITVRNYGLSDTIFAMFIPTAISTFYVILIKNYFEGLPPSLEESARIDGYNDIQILFKIVIPMSTPAFAAIALFYAIFFWNEYFYATLFISVNKLYPLPVLLRQLIVQNLAMAQIGVQTMASNAEQFKMACLIIAIFPIVAVFPFVQRYFTKGLNMGAIKG
jgi:putative aldouronate transport system permease protein